MSVHIGPNPIINDGLLLHYDTSKSENYLLSEVEVLVVAGGGGGGTGGGGGGGGGLLYSNSYKVTPGTPISVTVGGGGGNTSTWGGAGTQGQNSVFGDLTATGGGAGNHRAGNSSTGTGGSGGGDAGGSGYVMNNGTPGQGYPGGNSPEGGSTDEEPGGGGGGAGGPGKDAQIPNDSGNAAANSALAGAGGPGLPFSISGSLRYYAGGGGGSNRNGVGQPGGIGGGGSGGASPTAGAPNSGGGGGGTGYSGYGGGGTSAVGGSGVVIVRYPGPQKATGGNSIIGVGGYTIHTFTSSGSFTPSASLSNVYGLQDFSYNSKTVSTQIGGVTYNSSNGGILNFDGSNDYVNTNYDLSWNHTNSVTVSLFLRPNSLSGYYPFIGKGPSNWEWQLMQNGTGLQFVYWNSGGGHSNGPIPDINNFFTSTTDFVFLSLVWNHLDNNYYFYRNSSLVSTVGWTNASINQNRTDPIHLGGNIYQWGTQGQYWSGSIASLSLYNRALTETEITQNFNAQRGRFGI